MALFQQQFIAATTGVGGGFAMVKYYLAGGADWRLQPKRDRKRIGAGKMANAWKSETTLTVQFRCLAAFAGNQPWSLMRLPRSRSLDAVSDLVLFDFIEAEGSHQARDGRVRRLGLEPFRKGGASGVVKGVRRAVFHCFNLL